MDQEFDDISRSGPPLQSFIDLSKALSDVMNYGHRRRAKHLLMKRNGRILKEIKQFQFIQFDLHHCLMSNEKRQIMKDALFAAQKVDFLLDPPEVQDDQLYCVNSNFDDQNDKKVYIQKLGIDDEENESGLTLSYKTKYPRKRLDNRDYDGRNGNSRDYDSRSSNNRDSFNGRLRISNYNDDNFNDDDYDSKKTNKHEGFFPPNRRFIKSKF